MKTISKMTLALGVALTGLVAAAPQAGAASNGLGGFAGHADNSSQASCFSENYGSVVSSCSSQPPWEIVMPVNSPGSYWTPALKVFGNGVANPIICGADAASTDRLSLYVSPQQSAVNTQTLTFSVYVPASGYLFTACYMGAGTEWYGVNY